MRPAGLGGERGCDQGPADSESAASPAGRRGGRSHDVGVPARRDRADRELAAPRDVQAKRVRGRECERARTRRRQARARGPVDEARVLADAEPCVELGLARDRRRRRSGSQRVEIERTRRGAHDHTVRSGLAPAATRRRAGRLPAPTCHWAGESVEPASTRGDVVSPSHTTPFSVLSSTRMRTANPSPTERAVAAGQRRKQPEALDLACARRARRSRPRQAPATGRDRARRGRPASRRGGRLLRRRAPDRARRPRARAACRYRSRHRRARCVARAVRGPCERCPARGLGCECKRVGAASQQQVDGAAPSVPRRVVEGGPTELTTCVDRRSDVEQQRRRLDAALACRDHECPRQIAARPPTRARGRAAAAHGRLAVAAQAVADEQVGRGSPPGSRRARRARSAMSGLPRATASGRPRDAAAGFPSTLRIPVHPIHAKDGPRPDCHGRS